MRICRFNGGRYGLVQEGLVRDITELVASETARGRAPAWTDKVIAALPQILAALIASPPAGPELPIAKVKFDAPVEFPGKIIGAPVNYQDHIDEMIGNPVAASHKQRDIGKAGLFLKANSSLAGPSDRLVLRFPDRRTDHEVELVAVIGRRGSNISRGDALDHVAGYCLGLDITVRGPEDRSFRKSIDGYSIIGPWLVTPDELGDPGRVAISLSVNGDLRQSASTADLVYDVPELIAFASSFYTLFPGDLIYTGTPAGVGPIVAGDLIEAHGQGLGCLRIDVA